MGQHIALLVLGVLILQRGISLEVRPPRVAIIGGGIGGASASHFLTELFNGSVQIHVYEAAAVGGRLSTIKIGEDEVEAGGSRIYPKNIYMQRFVKLLGLEKTTSSDGNFAVWEENKLVFLINSMITEQILSILYGDEPYNLRSHGNNILQDFLKIYDLQDAGQSFISVATLLSAINKDFPKRLQRSTRNYLLNTGFTKKLINKLAQAATVMNCGQEVDIHSFVGLLSATVLNNDLWSVKSGNKKVPQLLINRNKNVRVVQSRVTKIRNSGNIYDWSRLYEVTHINRDSEEPIISLYDIIIIATPLTSDQEFPIIFVDFPYRFLFPGNYQTTYATFLKADLNLEYFHLQMTVDRIFSCDKTNISFIGKANPVDDSIKENSTVWKIFSKEHIDTSLIDNMFSNITEIVEMVWKYPRYSTGLHFDNFMLHHALYHVNVIEWAASTMEMSAIAGRNVAILAHKNFFQKSYDFVSNNKTAESLTEYMHTEF